MRELVYFVAVSLDGYIAGPGGAVDAFAQVGDHIDGLLRDYPETLPEPFLKAVGVVPKCEHFDTVVMGYNTYKLGLDAGLASPYPHLRQFVCSRQHASPSAEIAVTPEAPESLVRRLKSEPGKDIWLCGGGQLAASLWGEVDRLFLKVNPLLLHGGVPMLASGAGTAEAFRLIHSRVFDSGVVFNEYRRADPT
ncbi:MAG: dihydrofolate reductase family protein [Myxococcales bacterium]|nr:dihydrofolate reductase family protein [Myxococcales bacterium]MDD9964980.1 dihydrofolate reductase family protein [Myxococcales bacterium]